jgi:hypothetical protein
MKLLVLLIVAFALPAARAGVAQEKFLAATESARQVVIRRLEPPAKNRAALLDSTDMKAVARVRRSMVLEDPAPQFDEHGEEIWTLPSFCCAQYSVEFVSRDGDRLLYLVKHEITAILPPDPHGLHDLTDIPLSKKSRHDLRVLLTGR